MDRELAQKWVDALESGKYPKGVHSLAETRNGSERFCCLGVLADLTDQLAPDPLHIRRGESTYRVVRDPDSKTVQRRQSSGGLLPPQLAACGLTDAEQWSLAEINDDSETFKPVIEEIKRRWLS